MNSLESSEQSSEPCGLHNRTLNEEVHMCAEEKMAQLHSAELLRVNRIVHSRIANIECDSFVHTKSLPQEQENSALADNCFFWSCTVDADTLEISA